MTNTIYDIHDIEIKIGSRVIIKCSDDPKYFNKVGIVRLIDQVSIRNNRDTWTCIFVQMIRGGHGQWWRREMLDVHKPRKR